MEHLMPLLRGTAVCLFDCLYMKAKRSFPKITLTNDALRVNKHDDDDLLLRCRATH
jgi:hypothetical protein